MCVRVCVNNVWRTVEQLHGRAIDGLLCLIKCCAFECINVSNLGPELYDRDIRYRRGLLITTRYCSTALARRYRCVVIS